MEKECVVVLSEMLSANGRNKLSAPSTDFYVFIKFTREVAVHWGRRGNG